MRPGTVQIHLLNLQALAEDRAACLSAEEVSRAARFKFREDAERWVSCRVRLREILRHGAGHLCILVPARQELYSRLDSDFGHFRRYDKPLLAGRLREAGFKVRHIHYFNFAGYFAWGLRYKLLRGRSFDINQVRLFDRRIFPLVHRFESGVCRPPFGQSLIAIAQA